MPYDEDLANRLRELLASRQGITERRMFGGLAFLLHGNMVIAAHSKGGLLARVDPTSAADVLALAHAQPMRMRGRTMDGWITIAPEGLKTKRQLEAWVSRALTFARTLPPKG
jgi:TfoX/Sxy family transcriptional regulator of competence genes